MPIKKSRNGLRQQPAINLATEFEIFRHVENSEDKLVKRLDEVATELRDRQQTSHTYLNERISIVETNLSKKIDDQSENLAKHFDTSIDKLDQKWDGKFTGINDRVSALEKWRWLIAGGGLVVLWIFSRFLIDKLFP